MPADERMCILAKINPVKGVGLSALAGAAFALAQWLVERAIQAIEEHNKAKSQAK